MNEKRNSDARIDQCDMFDADDAAGVGARQAGQRAPARGGGYRKICGPQNFDPTIEDPRLGELRTIGLPRLWMLVAETVGVDAFLDVWRRLTDEGDEHGYARETGGVKMPGLRSYDAYLRYQRNRYIDDLAAQGMTAHEIRRAVARNLRESLDEKHVFKLMRKR